MLYVASISKFASSITCTSHHQCQHSSPALIISINIQGRVEWVLKTGGVKRGLEKRDHSNWFLEKVCHHQAFADRDDDELKVCKES